MEIHDNVSVPLGNEFSSMDSENYDLNLLLASFCSENSCDWNGENTEGMDSIHGDSSSLDGGQLKATTESQFVLSDRDHGTNDVVLSPNCLMESFTGQDPYFDARSGGVSSSDSLRQQLLPENSFACSKFTVQDSSLPSLYSMNNSLDNQHSSSQASVVAEFDFSSSSNTKDLEPVDMSEEFLKFSSMDDLCQWFDPSPEDNSVTCRTVSSLDNTLSEPMEFDPNSFGFVGSSFAADLPDGKRTYAAMNNNGYENSLLESMEPDLCSDPGDDLWANMFTPAVSNADDGDYAEFLSNLDISTLKGLFSELGIDELLSAEPNYMDGAYFDYEIMEDFPHVNGNQMQYTNLAWPENRGNSNMQGNSELDKTNNLVSKNLLCLDDSHSIKLGETVLVQHKKTKDEPKKPVKKKAKPGESTRQRPKDRQRIQDSIKALRGLLPDREVEKYSIDYLLGCCIRYMKFLASTTHYANKLQEPQHPKLIEQANGVISQEDSKKLVSPIIVEDMSQPGQMLIEMLCEEKSFSFELADIIKGLGLNILKAKMEVRNTKLWARFIVEAEGNVTRIDVFWFLDHLLQQKNNTEIDLDNSQYFNASDASISGLNIQLPEKK